VYLPDDTTIALGAFLVAALAGLHSVRTAQKQGKMQEEQLDIQRKLAAYDLRDHEAAEERSKRAEIRVILERDPDRFILTNVGQARALDVRLHVEAFEYKGAILEAELRRKLPISVLDPGTEVTFGALVAWQHSPAFNVRVTWSDSDGSPREFETVLHT
jgi:hypothetical protein